MRPVTIQLLRKYADKAHKESIKLRKRGERKSKLGAWYMANQDLENALVLLHVATVVLQLVERKLNEQD